MEENKIARKEKKLFLIWIVVILGIVFVLAAIVGTDIVSSVSKERKVQAQLVLGQKYLNELNYEQAIIAYEEAIKIEPNCVEAYLGLAEVYVILSDYEQAIGVLQNGYDITKDERLKKRLEEVIVLNTHVHDWMEANYQEPKRCSGCDETEGGPLEPGFEKMGLAFNVQLGENYDYITCTSMDSSLPTIAQLTFTDYRVFEGDELHEPMEGYEWRSVHASALYGDENAWNYGCKYRWLNFDYYFVNEEDEIKEDKENDTKEYTINYMGKDFTECCFQTEDGKFREWSENGTCEFHIDFFARVPIGYDGMVIAFCDAAKGDEIIKLNEQIDENTLFFRMD